MCSDVVKAGQFVISRWRGLTLGRVDYAPSQQVSVRFPEIPQAVFDRSVVLITQEGAAFTGAALA